MIFTDVFGETQVMQLAGPERRRQVTMVTKAGRVVTTETHIMWKKGEKKKQSKHFYLLFDANFEKLSNIVESVQSCSKIKQRHDSFYPPLVRLSQGWSGWGSCRCGRPCTQPSGRVPWSLLPAAPTHRWSVETRQHSKCDDRNPEDTLDRKLTRPCKTRTTLTPFPL